MSIYKTWIFGNHAGMDFDPGNIQGISTYNGNAIPMSQLEGCASICDAASGNLLFYTDGISVWDADGIDQGIHLEGTSTSTQSALIVPHTAFPGEYFIFTTTGSQQVGPGFANRHLYGIRLAYPSFSETLLNLPEPTDYFPTEKLCAVQHGNGKDFWVMTMVSDRNQKEFQGHGWFRRFHIDSTGANEVLPMIDAGFTINDQGQMKISHDGTMIAFANSTSRNVIVYQFDDMTGNVGPLIKAYPIPQVPHYNARHAYGLEFSPSNQYLYFAVNGAKKSGGPAAAQNGYVFQADLNNTSAAPVEVAEHPNLSTISNKDYALGQMQLGIDGKIYMALDGERKVAAINQPDVAGIGCDVDFNAIDIPNPPAGSGITYNPGAGSFLGLPNLIANLH